MGQVEEIQHSPVKVAVVPMGRAEGPGDDVLAGRAAHFTELIQSGDGFTEMQGHQWQIQRNHDGAFPGWQPRLFSGERQCGFQRSAEGLSEPITVIADERRVGEQRIAQSKSCHLAGDDGPEWQGVVSVFQKSTGYRGRALR